jgi:hypothetical protein
MIEQFHDRLWDKIVEAAKGLDGAEALRMVQDVSARVNEAGIDEINAQTCRGKPNPQMDCAFDFTWLSPLLLELRKATKARRGRK